MIFTRAIREREEINGLFKLQRRKKVQPVVIETSCSHCFMATDSLTALSVNSIEATPPAPEPNMLPVLHIDSVALNTA